LDDVVAIAASAGGLRALRTVLDGLPATFAAPVLVVQHLDPNHRSLMAEILSRSSALRVTQAEEGDRIEPGRVFIGPPDHHLLVNEDGTLSLSRSKLIHFLRPSADLLFESVAAAYEDHAIGVVLSGTGSDGSLGVQAIKGSGGRVIVQDPATAEFSGMPSSAVRTQCVDAILPLEEIAGALETMVERSAG
jgi:two-component system, chemotaxis family, protein-glutamate methylesterase/glutaminase